MVVRKQTKGQNRHRPGPLGVQILPGCTVMPGFPEKIQPEMNEVRISWTSIYQRTINQNSKPESEPPVLGPLTCHQGEKHEFLKTYLTTKSWEFIF